MAENTVEDIVEEDLEGELSFEEAVKRAEAGQFDHTLFEIWEDMIAQGIRGVQQPLNIATANSILRSWPWLRMKDLPLYLHSREVLLQETLDALQTVYGEKKDDIFEENVGDWDEHKDLYIDAIVIWTQLTNQWTEDWIDIPVEKRLKGIHMAAVADIQSLIMGEEGFISQMRNLNGFHITDAEGEGITARLMGVSDE